jgi:hypothetical protein
MLDTEQEQNPPNRSGISEAYIHTHTHTDSISQKTLFRVRLGGGEDVNM